jgi:hypothetical protein
LFSDSYELAFLAYLVGLLSLLVVFRFGALTTVIGFLVTVFVARYYFVPLVVKAAEGHPIWHNLRAPTETLLVLVCTLLAMVVASAFLRERKPISEGTLSFSERRHVRRLTIVTFFIGVFATTFLVAAQSGGQVAFLSGAGGIFGLLLPFSLSLAIYVPLMQQSRKVLLNPSVISLLAANALFGFITTQRYYVVYVLVAIAVPYLVARRHIASRHVRSLIISMSIGLFVFVFVMNPAMLYLRTSDPTTTEFSSVGQRTAYMSEFWSNTVSDPASITTINARVSDVGHYIHYFDNYYGGLERFAILPDNDRLISGTKLSNEYGGWRTITWGIEMVPPRFIYPDKPTLGPGAYLGHVAGLSFPTDYTTQWAFGFPSELYHAFSYPGVFFGTIALLGLFFLVVTLFDLLGVSPVWKLLIVIYYWTTFSEGHFANILPTIVPLAILAIALDYIVRHTERRRFALRRPVRPLL